MTNSVSDEEVRVAAYYLWEKEGRPEGADFDLWVRAKNELAKKAGQVSKPVEKKAAPVAEKKTTTAPVASTAAPAKKANNSKKRK